ncbi:MAG: class I SAM-dependent methyltransferase [Lautropia sp.]|nr:class I SAM-dependent methyltransferase [Lautropia sp.]
MNYQKDPGYNLYFRPEAEAFGYSEGQEAEKRLLDIVESLSDRSTFSVEFLPHIVDWSTRYHFTRARHCLLRPLDILPGERVLELGCGTGAITRYLGETGADITAVEGSLARARVAAARCHDLPNVRVIADDLQAAEVEGKYDWVTLIGVLEYAGAYSDAADPYQSYLAAAMRHLKPGGRVVIAIENQLGLKYFNGCGEDHLAKPFLGIQDLYAEQGGVRTFGRKALSAILDRAGLKSQQWLYPYPDYKVPSIVISDEALHHPAFNASDLLLRNDSEDYNGQALRVFDEALVNQVLGQNGLLGDLANSFLVVAAPAAGKGMPSWKPAALAWTFSTLHRQVGLGTETRFIRQDAGRIRVSKRRVKPELPDHVPFLDGQRISLAVGDTDYFPGNQMAWRTLRVHVADGSLPAIVRSLQPWCEALMSAARVEVSPLMTSIEAPEVQGAAAAEAGEGAGTEADADAPRAAGSAAADPSGQANAQDDEAQTVARAVAQGQGKPARLLSLPGESTDLVPFNILVDSQGRQRIIDQEWVVSCPVPAGWVVTRGVMHALLTGAAPPDSLGSVSEVVIALLAACGYHATPEDVDAWLNIEERFLRSVSARPVGGLFIATQRPVPLMMPTVSSLRVEKATADQALAQAQDTIELLNQQMAHQNAELVASLSRIDKYQQRIRALESDVETLMNSRSWRWSGWMRSLRRRTRI